jgi:hypothetical protein
MLSVAVITVLLTITGEIREKTGRELARFGASLIVSHAGGGRIPDSLIREVRASSSHIRGMRTQLYGTLRVNGKWTEVIGTEIDKMTGYRLRGEPPRRDLEIMAGVLLENARGISTGTHIPAGDLNLVVTAVFERTEAENASLVVPMQTARQLFGAEGADALLLDVDSRHVTEVGAEIMRRHEMLAVKPVRSIIVAESNLLDRLELLMRTVTLFVLITSLITAGSALGTRAIERTAEIGLMKALGATGGTVSRFFMVEALISGTAGSLAGCLLGIALAEAVSRTVFGTFTAVSLLDCVGAAGVGIGIAALAVIIPIRYVLSLSPADTLRGE